MVHTATLAILPIFGRSTFRYRITRSFSSSGTSPDYSLAYELPPMDVCVKELWSGRNECCSDGHFESRRLSLNVQIERYVATAFSKLSGGQTSFNLNVIRHRVQARSIVTAIIVCKSLITFFRVSTPCLLIFIRCLAWYRDLQRLKSHRRTALEMTSSKSRPGVGAALDL